MSGLDHLFGRAYDAARYNCLHFVRDVWLELTGEDLAPRLGSVLVPGERDALRATMEGFARLRAPEDPCIAFMHRARAAPHIGVYFGGRIMHLTELGVEYLPPEVASRGFTSVRFYR